jgi:membrane protein DedA with SNARE-associated domain/rhodanese-related sulfurtransferase
MQMFNLVAHYGLVLVFVNILLEQLGLPIPGVPTLVVAGALVTDGRLSGPGIFVVTLLACALADGAWYIAGRLYGYRVMRLLCRISLSPDSCVRRSEEQFRRWGPLAIVLGKFVPGLSTIMSPMAGAIRFNAWSFALFEGLGSIIWAAVFIGAGIVFRRQIDWLIAEIVGLGEVALAVIVVLVAVYIAFKWWQRWRFAQKLRMARITPGELRDLLRREMAPLVVDLRAAAIRTDDDRTIPGAIILDHGEIESHLGPVPLEREIVFLCNCPNEASAVMAAKRLMEMGHTRVRPLLGGLDGWVAAGYELEPVADEVQT